MTEQTTRPNGHGRGVGELVGSAGVGCVVTGAGGLAVAVFVDWGESPRAEWLTSGWWPAVACLGVVLALGAARETQRGIRLRGVLSLAAVAVLLLAGCGWVQISDNAPQPSGLGWPLTALSTALVTAGAVLLGAGGWRRRRTALRAGVTVIAVVVLVTAVGVASFAGRHSLNVDSTTTAAPLSDPVRDPLRGGRAWFSPSHGYQRAVAVSPAGVFITDNSEAEVGETSDAASLVALDPVTGERRWSYTDTANPPGDPIAEQTGATVLVTSGGKLLVFDAVTGHLRDRIEQPPQVAAAYQEMILAESTTGGGDRFHNYVPEAPDGLAAYDLAGARVWDTPLPPHCVLASSWSGNIAPADG